MSKRMVLINMIMVMLDFTASLACIALFAFCAVRFNHWWIGLFALIPLGLFSGHGLIIDADIAEAQKGGEDGA